MKHLALTASMLLATSTATAQSLTVSGMWETDSGAIHGSGGGHIQMQVKQSGRSVIFSYGRHTMECNLVRTACRGLWHGGTGAGWFAVNFTPDGRRFSGQWAYNNDRQSGSFSGHR